MTVKYELSEFRREDGSEKIKSLEKSRWLFAAEGGEGRRKLKSLALKEKNNPRGSFSTSTRSLILRKIFHPQQLCYWNDIKCSGEEESGREKANKTFFRSQVAKRKLFITFIRYQNVNNSMIKWPNGDINRAMSYFAAVFLISEQKEEERKEVAR